MAKNQARVLAATTTKKTANFGNPNRIFTLMNDGSGSIFFRQQDKGRAFAGTAVELYALGGSQLKAGEPATMKGITWDYACASDTGTTATGRVIEGIVGASVNATLSGVVINSDLETVGGVAVNTSSGNIDGGTQVVNQATNGVNGVAFGLAADGPVVDGSFHSKLEYIGTQNAAAATDLAAIEVLITSANVDHAANEVLLTSLQTLLTAQALLLAPPVSTGLTAVATSDAEWTPITLTANAVKAEFSLTGGNAYYVCQTAQPADADTGAIGYANILYAIGTSGRTKIWIRRTAAANVTIHATDYSTA